MYIRSVSDTWRGRHSLVAQSATTLCGRSWHVQQQPNSVWCLITAERASPAKKVASPINKRSLKKQNKPSDFGRDVQTVIICQIRALHQQFPTLQWRGRLR